MDISADLTRIALAEDGELKELYYESKREESLVGNVYAGRVANVMPNLQAAFVDIGAEKNGYYYYGNARAVSDAEKNAEQHTKKINKPINTGLPSIRSSLSISLKCFLYI